MLSEELCYSGHDELSIMQECKNYNASIVKKILNYIPPKSLTILDFGAGIGTLAEILQPYGYTIQCVEIDQTQAKILTNKDFFVYTALDEVPNNSINFIYSSNVLEHIENDQRILTNLYQKLYPGGGLFLYLPAFQALYTEMDKKIGHFRRYQAKDLKMKLAKAGFSIQEIGYADSLGFLATYLLKRLNNGSSILTKEKVRFYDLWLFPISHILDRICNRYFGKNIWVYAIKE